MKTLMLFRSTGSCGCSPSGSSSPSEPAVLCSSEYLTLARLARLKLVGVGVDGQCQAFLKAAGTTEVPLAGFAFVGADGFAYVERAPSLALPYINKAGDGSFRSSDTFTTLLASAGAGDGDRAWQFYAAPSVGSYILQSDNGAFRFIDAGTVPGVSAVCASGVSATKVQVFGCAQTGTDGNGDPIMGLRKLTPVDGAVVVGIIPGDGSYSGFRTLPADEALEHPLLKITTTASLKTLSFLDASDNDIADGLATSVGYGTGALADMVGVRWSPSIRQLVQQPPHVRYVNIVNGVQTWVRSGGFTQIPGGHAQATAQNIHYSAVRIRGDIYTNSGENADVALFRDGSQIALWDFGTARDMQVEFIDTTVTKGQRTYDFRLRGGSGGSTGNIAVRASSIIVETLP